MSSNIVSITSKDLSQVFGGEEKFQKAQLSEGWAKIYGFFGCATAVTTSDKGKIYLTTSALNDFRKSIGTAENKLYDGERKLTVKLLVEMAKEKSGEKVQLKRYNADDAKQFEKLLKNIDHFVEFDASKIQFPATRSELLAAVNLFVPLSTEDKREKLRAILNGLKQEIKKEDQQIVNRSDQHVTVLQTEEPRQEAPKPTTSFDIKKLTIDKKGRPIKGLVVDKEINAETFKKFGNDKHSQAVQIRHLAGLSGHKDSYSLIAKMDPELFGIFLVRDTFVGNASIKDEKQLDLATLNKLLQIRGHQEEKKQLQKILTSALKENEISSVPGYKTRISEFLEFLDSTAKDFIEFAEMKK